MEGRRCGEGGKESGADAFSSAVISIGEAAQR